MSTSVIHLYVNLCNSIRVFHFIFFLSAVCSQFKLSVFFPFVFFLPSSYIDSLNDVVVVFQTLACKSEYLIYLILYVCICSSMHKRLCFIYVADADYRFDKSIFFYMKMWMCMCLYVCMCRRVILVLEPTRAPLIQRFQFCAVQ